MILAVNPSTFLRLRAPRIRGDDPDIGIIANTNTKVLPAYAGMIPTLA